jgi:hypothetical protein
MLGLIYRLVARLFALIGVSGPCLFLLFHSCRHAGVHIRNQTAPFPGAGVLDSRPPDWRPGPRGGNLRPAPGPRHWCARILRLSHCRLVSITPFLRLPTTIGCITEVVGEAIAVSLLPAGLPQPPGSTAEAGDADPSGTSHPRQQSSTSAAAAAAAAAATQTASRGFRGARRITVSVPGVLFKETDPAALSSAATPLPAAAAALRAALATAGPSKPDLYLLAHVEDDIGEAVVRGTLEHAGLVSDILSSSSSSSSSSGAVCPPHRLLLCGTLEGKVALVRQLESELHIDADLKTVENLRRFVPQIIRIETSLGGYGGKGIGKAMEREGGSSSAAAGTGGNVATAWTLEEALR